MKKFTKRILPLLVATAMSFCSSSVVFAAETSNGDVAPTSAGGVMPLAGEETWGHTGYYRYHVGSFSMVGSNMTKTKTIDNGELCRYLTIFADYTCSSSSKLKVEIVDASTGAVYASGTSKAGKSGSIAVQTQQSMRGKKVKIRFIIQDANGNYAPSRSCNVDYSYSLSSVRGE